jgi:lipase
MTPYRTFATPVRGGSLAGGVWNAESASAGTVLAVHGITASHLAWPLVADRLEGHRMIAPDLRGRGRSNSLPAPWAIHDHADDMVRVLDHWGVERAVIVGHSMGGFVAVRLAERLAEQHPTRVTAVVLLDGGLPLPTLPGVPAAELPARLLGPAGERLKQTYSNRLSYEQLWRRHPAFENDWSEAVARYVNYDLEEYGDVFRPSSRFDAIAANIVQLTGEDGYREALSAIRVPLSFLHAPRGLLDETPPLYSAELVAEAQRLAPGLRISEADNVNHYTIVMSERGAQQVARLVLNELGVPR